MHRPRRNLLGIVVALVTLIASGALSWTSRWEYDHTESRLIGLRVKEAGSVLAGALPAIQTPLASAAALADATDGDVGQFKGFMARYTGTGRPFVSASLWRPGDSMPIAVVGSAPVIADSADASRAFFSRTDPPAVLHMTELMRAAASTRLGYAFTTPGGSLKYTVYGEGAIATTRPIRIASDSAFADLDYALYVGRTPIQAALLQASVSRVPIGGRHATAVVPFGDSAFTLVMAPRHSLSGALPERLPWIIAVVGVLLSAAFAILTQRLSHRRRDAEVLAAELDGIARDNRRLYAEQRNVAETLQLALLPADLPRSNSAEMAVHYEPGVKGIHIGGDWYDVITRQDQLLLVVGDVSGRGLPAATVMASLLYGARAYAAQGDAPDAILSKLSNLLRVDASGRFATVLCVLLDLARHQITLASAGHLPPLLVQPGSARYLTCPIGPPIGVASTRYEAATVDVPESAILVAFTDGLVERRTESLDVGLERLRELASWDGTWALATLVSTLVRTLLGAGGDDDTVVLGVRWLS